MIRNNQNGRRRGRGGARPPQGGGPSGNYGNSNGGGSRIDTRQRGNASQLLEKYKAMARDATQNGDRVQAEFYMQYADHYFRVVNEFRARDPQPAPRQQFDDDEYDAPLPGQNYTPPSYADDDGDDERQPERSVSNGAGAGNGNGNGNGGDRYAGQRNDRPRDGYQGERGNDRAPRDRAYAAPRDGGDGYARNDALRFDARQEGERDGGRDGGRDDGREQRTDGQRDGRRGEVQRVDSQRSERSRNDVQSSDGSRDEPRADRPREARREPVRSFTPREQNDDRDETQLIGLPGPATIAVAQPVEADPAPVAEAPAPRRRGRPRKVVADAVDG